MRLPEPTCRLRRRGTRGPRASPRSTDTRPRSRRGTLPGAALLRSRASARRRDSARSPRGPVWHTGGRTAGGRDSKRAPPHPSTPHLPCRTMPGPAPPDRAAPCQAMPCLACRTPPHQASPPRAKTDLASPAAPNRARTGPASQYHACRTSLGPRLTRTSRTPPRLAYSCSFNSSLARESFVAACCNVSSTCFR